MRLTGGVPAPSSQGRCPLAHLADEEDALPDERPHHLPPVHARHRAGKIHCVCEVAGSGGELSAVCGDARECGSLLTSARFAAKFSALAAPCPRPRKDPSARACLGGRFTSLHALWAHFRRSRSAQVRLATMYSLTASQTACSVQPRAARAAQRRAGSAAAYQQKQLSSSRSVAFGAPLSVSAVTASAGRQGAVVFVTAAAGAVALLASDMVLHRRHDRAS